MGMGEVEPQLRGPFRPERPLGPSSLPSQTCRARLHVGSPLPPRNPRPTPPKPSPPSNSLRVAFWCFDVGRGSARFCPCTLSKLQPRSANTEMPALLSSRYAWPLDTACGKSQSPPPWTAPRDSRVPHSSIGIRQSLDPWNGAIKEYGGLAMQQYGAWRVPVDWKAVRISESGIYSGENSLVKSSEGFPALELHYDTD